MIKVKKIRKLWKDARGHKFSSKVKLIVRDKQKLLRLRWLSDTEVFYQAHEESRQFASVPSTFIR